MFRPRFYIKYSIRTYSCAYARPISRNGQGFSNHLLDQTVIRDVQAPDIHATVSNQPADFWERAFPGRVEEVPTPQHIKGEDF
jgi:hypothetical protein